MYMINEYIKHGTFPNIKVYIKYLVRNDIKDQTSCGIYVWKILCILICAR